MAVHMFYCGNILIRMLRYSIAPLSASKPNWPGSVIFKRIAQQLAVAGASGDAVLHGHFDGVPVERAVGFAVFVGVVAVVAALELGLVEEETTVGFFARREIRSGARNSQ